MPIKKDTQKPINEQFTLIVKARLQKEREDSAKKAEYAKKLSVKYKRRK